MKILALDSTSPTATVALLDDAKLISIYTVNVKNSHSEILLPMVKSSLESAGVGISEIDAFACCVGPGSYTGIRIGAATLKGLAFGSGKPCIGISSIEAMAENLAGYDGIICPVINARRDQVYTALFSGKRLTDDCCITLDELTGELSKYKKRVYFAGDAYESAKNRAMSFGIEVGETPEMLKYPSAYSCGVIAFRHIKEGKITSDTELSPVYLKKVQAEREREERLEKQNEK